MSDKRSDLGMGAGAGGDRGRAAPRSVPAPRARPAADGESAGGALTGPLDAGRWRWGEAGPPAEPRCQPGWWAGARVSPRPLPAISALGAGPGMQR